MSALTISPEQIGFLQKENTELRGLNVLLQASVAELKAQLALMKQKFFGGGQSDGVRSTEKA